MNRRALFGVGVAVAVLAVSGVGTAFPVAASSYTTINFSPAPIAPNGSLSIGDTVSVCVQAKTAGTPTAGVSVNLSLNNAAIPQDLPPQAGESGGTSSTASVTNTTTPGPLTSGLTSFTTPSGTNTCTPTGTSAHEADAIAITYTFGGPATPVAGGRDSLYAQDPSNTSDTASIQYEFSSVTQYVYSVGSTIAPSGSLASGQQVSLTVEAEDASNAPVPCAQVWLSTTSSASPSGSVQAQTGTVSGCPSTPLITVGSSALRVITDNSGQVEITYSAANPLPSAGGQDLITVQNHHVVVTLSVSTSYTYSAYGGYTLDGFGGVHPVGGAPAVTTTGYWPGWTIARTLAMNPCDAAGQYSGWVMDGFGGLHPFAATGTPMPAAPATSGYWPGWTIANDFAAFCLTVGGVHHAAGCVLDGFGGLHPWADSASILPDVSCNGSGYWPGWDIATRITVIPGTDQGYVMDGFGGLHPFNGAPNYAPSGYWPGWTIARDVVATSNGGYTLDGFGGVHPFGSAPAITPSGYWPGWDIARAIDISAGGTGAYTLDGFGGVHPVGGAAPVSVSGYWPGWDIAIDFVSA